MTKFKCNGPDFKAHLDKTRPSISLRSIVEGPAETCGYSSLGPGEGDADIYPTLTDFA